MHFVTAATVTLPGADLTQILQPTHTMNCHMERIYMVLHLVMPLTRFLPNTCTTEVVLEKLVPCLNSQRNESLNGTIGSKNPKIRYYGDSESSDFRIACGVAQHNEGHEYVSKTLTTLGINPGKQCEDYHKMLDRKQVNDNARKSTTKFKLRRRTLFTNKAHKQTRKESQEATSYQSNIGLNLDPNAQQHQGENLTILNDIDLGECKTILKDCEAPLLDPIVRPEVQPHVYDQQSYFYNFLTWDTETTTIGKSAEIVQISVVSKDEQFCFSEYVTPKTAISPAASLVHGLTTQVSNGVNVLYKDGKEVQSIPLQECLTRLLNFIETTRDHYNRETHKPVITDMVGHNSALFDTPVLLRSAGSSFVDQVTSLDVVFADSLLLFKSIRKSELPSSTILLPCKGNKLISLYSHLFKEDFHAHDAIEDVKALIKILFKSSLEITTEQVIGHGRVATAKQAYDDKVFLDERHARAETYRRMCHPDGRSVISDAIKQKLSVKGIVYETLGQIYRQFGKAGLFAIIALPMSTESDKKSRPRITAYPRIQAAILEHFRSILCS